MLLPGAPALPPFLVAPVENHVCVCALLRMPLVVLTSRMRPVTLSLVQARSVAVLPSAVMAVSVAPLLAILLKSNPASPVPILLKPPLLAA